MSRLPTPLASFPKVTFTKVGLIFDQDLDFDEWVRLGELLRQVVKASLWWWGDWLVYGEGRGDWGEMYSQALEESDYKYGSLANAAYVARRFEFSRRRENLPWSFHQAVAPLDPEDAQRLLEQAEAENWTRSKLIKQKQDPKEEKAKLILKYWICPYNDRQHQTCKKCGRIQRFEFSVSDEVWGEVSPQWQAKALCVECFLEDLDMQGKLKGEEVCNVV